ncbi:hypothetical protein ACFT4A_31875 [Streptomyces sp. NPDC057099]|uniref:hypothetical protein n=1 Tax=Streptomyces sp. NPDC057099 TaxID=3346019 RepID=UPI00362581CB
MPVADIMILTGDEQRRSSDRGAQPPEGYKKVEVDLNRNAGGDYIFLCYARDDRHEPIEDLKVITSSSPNPSPPPGFRRIDTDLNSNADGSYIYLCERKDVVLA